MIYIAKTVENVIQIIMETTVCRQILASEIMAILQKISIETAITICMQILCF